MSDSPWKAAASWWQSRSLAKKPASDQKTASKLLGRMKIIPNDREKDGKEESIPDMGRHGAMGRVSVSLKRTKLSQKDTPTLVMCSQNITP